MKKLSSIFSITVCILLWGVFVSFSQDRHPALFRENETYTYKSSYQDSAALDSYIREYMTQNHIPGVSACIVKQGRIIWTGNYGWAYVNLIIPVYDSTLFQIASVSKTVTTAALMRLYDQDRFKLDDSINAYLPFPVRNPYYPDSAITFRMLLTHTSSIRDNWNFMFYYFHSDPPLPLRDYLNDYFTPDSQYYSLQNFNNFPPGRSFQYCNIGFALAGYLVEAITGIEESKYCRDSLFTLLGMNESSFFYRDLDTMHMAMPYMWNSGYIPYGHYSYHDYPAGALKTSTIQLARFLIAFMQYGWVGSVRILDSATVSLMITPQIPLIYSGQGLCWYKLYLGTRQLWGHHGGDFGIRTGMFFCPADTTGVLVFTNGEYPTDAIMNEMFNYAATYVISVRRVSSNIPAEFKLHQNYPNPFNPSTKIQFSIPPSKGVRGMDVKLIIYDLLGREVATLVNEQLKPGSYEVQWNASNFPSGVYFYRLTTDKFIGTKKMILVK